MKNRHRPFLDKTKYSGIAWETKYSGIAWENLGLGGVKTLARSPPHSASSN